MFTLNRMEIHGFKSFFSRTSFEFGRGITAVVGPNGCGKSNIGDAISWVLGDQSPKSLRADRMMDVIFSGSESRKATGMAEVTLKFLGTNGGPDPAEEFVVCRRLYRSGDSEYSLNGARCRLKDIQDMMTRSQVGSRLYSVIEQGKVDQILTSKPKERRTLFEEAAGIMGYKAKRRITLGKLEATEANLVRLNDILIEVERQTNSLRRQVAKARRFRKLQDKIREHRSVLLRAQLQHWEEEMKKAESVRQNLLQREAGLSAQLGRCEAKVEELRARTEETEAKARMARDRLNEIDRNMDREKMQLERSREQLRDSEEAIVRWAGEGQESAQRLQEREKKKSESLAIQEAERRSLSEFEVSLQEQEEKHRKRLESALSAEKDVENCRQEFLGTLDRLADAKNQYQRLEEDLRRTIEQSARLEEEISRGQEQKKTILSDLEDMSGQVSVREFALGKVKTEAVALEEKLKTQKDALDQVQATREELTGILAQGEERIRSLLAAEEGISGSEKGIQVVLSGARDGKLRVQGRVADLLEVDPEWLTATEAVLGGFLSAIRVEDPQEALDGIRYLRTTATGRCAFVASRGRNGGPPTIPSQISGDDRCSGLLSGKVRLQGEANGVLAQVLGGTILVRDLEAAIEFHRAYPQWSYVTSEGDLVRATGLIEGGTVTEGQRGLLSLRKEREEEKNRLAQARARRGELEQVRERNEREQEALQTQLVTLNKTIQDQERELVAARLQLEQREQERTRIDKDLEVATEESLRLATETKSLRGDSRQVLESLKSSELRRGELETRTAELAQVLSVRQEEVARGAEELGAFRSSLTAQRQKIAAREEEGRHHEQAVEEERQRHERALAEQKMAADKKQAMEKEIERLTASLVQGREKRGQVAEELEQIEADATSVKTDLLEGERQEKGARNDLNSLKTELSEAEVVVARLGVEEKHLDDSCREELNLTSQELRQRPLVEDGPPLSELEREMLELRTRLDRLGAVNLVALDEFQEMEQRQTFLQGQQKDLEESIQSLNETIRKLNRTSREKFLEAFEAIQKEFNRSFVALFGGGEAELRLMPDEDVLECGIEISASPPGKRLQSISLLSGGEKAMTAVALLFAIFRYRPSPFCVLDEVDAPLDEANVTRFVQMLRELTRDTQFILITHNRRSMEAADLLYGITMEEPGISKAVSMRLDN